MCRRVLMMALAAGVTASTGCWSCGDRPRLFHRCEPPCQLTAGGGGGPVGSVIGGAPMTYEGPPPAGLPAYPPPPPAAPLPRADELPLPSDLIPRQSVPAVPFAPPAPAPADPSMTGASRGGTPAKFPK